MQYLIFLMYYVTSQIVNTLTDAFEQSQKLKNKKKVENTKQSFIFSNLESTPSFYSEALHIRTIKHHMGLCRTTSDKQQKTLHYVTIYSKYANPNYRSNVYFLILKIRGLHWDLCTDRQIHG